MSLKINKQGEFVGKAGGLTFVSGDKAFAMAAKAQRNGTFGKIIQREIKKAK
jgi:multidrug resistance efflux pump